MAWPVEDVQTYVAEALMRLRTFHGAFDIDVEWDEDEEVPKPQTFGDRLRASIFNLELLPNITLGETFPGQTAPEALKTFEEFYLREKERCADTERDFAVRIAKLSENTIDARNTVGDVLAKVNEVIDLLSEETPTGTGGEVVAGFETVEVHTKDARTNLQLAEKKLTVSSRWWALGAERNTSIVEWKAPDVGSIWSHGSVWRFWGDASLPHWVSSMNQLILWAEPYFKTTDIVSSNPVRQALVQDELLPIHRSFVLTSEEKLAALRTLVQLSVNFAMWSEHPTGGESLPKKELIRRKRRKGAGEAHVDKVLRRSAVMMRVLYDTIKVYATLPDSALTDLESLIQRLAVGSLTLHYWLFFEKLNPDTDFSNMAEDFVSLDPRWGASIYEDIDWMDDAEELDPDNVDHALVIATALRARDDVPWDAPVE